MAKGAGGYGLSSSHMLAYREQPARSVTLCYIMEKRDRQRRKSQGSYGEKVKASGLTLGYRSPNRTIELQWKDRG